MVQPIWILIGSRATIHLSIIGFELTFTIKHVIPHGGIPHGDESGHIMQDAMSYAQPTHSAIAAQRLMQCMSFA